MLRTLAIGLAGLSLTFASSVALPQVRVSHDGEPQGFFKNISGGT